MKKPGRPKLKAKEKKEIFPLRLSALELKVIKDAAGDEPLAKWMRRKLLGTTPEGELPELSQPVKESIRRADTKAAMQRFAASLDQSKPLKK